MVLTGFHGDKAWDRHTEPSLDIERGDASGSSLYEFKLRSGFTHVPIPMIGILRHNDLHRIANSEEMRPWMIGGRYDRPIPRRIAEEAGVPREMFGQKKSAVATAVEPLGEMANIFFHEVLKRYSDHGAML